MAVGKFTGRKGDKISSAPEVNLAAFGKHPGWNDHIDDIGVETEGLIAAKRVLYQAIAGNIDGGKWEQMPQEQRVPGYRHVFAWRRGDVIYAGRLWSSRDGKGRSKYPMILCTECIGVGWDWVKRHVYGTLEQLEEECVSTEQSGEVVDCVTSARRKLRDALEGAAHVNLAVGVKENRLWEISEGEVFSQDRQGLIRILYQLDRELGPYREGFDVNSSGAMSLSARHFRYPRCSTGVVEAIDDWLCFMAKPLALDAEVLVILPMSQDWVDVVVGEPTVGELYCLQASPDAMPLSTDIPYSIDTSFVETVDGMLRASRRGESSDATGSVKEAVEVDFRSSTGSAETGGNVGNPSKSPVMLMVIIGLVLLLGLVVVLIVAIGGKEEPENPAPSGKRVAPKPDLTDVTTADQWAALCEGYASWYGPMEVSLKGGDADETPEEKETRAKRRRMFESDKNLKPILSAIDGKGGVLVNPYSLVTGKDDVALHRLKRRPPPKKDKEIRAARERMQAIKQGMIRYLSGKEYEGIPDQFEAYGWKAASRRTKNTIKSLDFSGGVNPVELVEEIWDTRREVSAVALLLKQIEDQATSISGTRDVVLGRFSDFRDSILKTFERGTTEVDSLRVIARRLKGFLSEHERLAAFVKRDWPKVAHELLEPIETGESITREMIFRRMRDGLACMPIPEVDDPRTKVFGGADWRKNLAEIAKRHQALKKTKVKGADDAFNQFVTERKALELDLQRLFGTAVVKKNVDQVRSRSQVLLSKMTELRGRSDRTVLRFTGDPKTWRAELKAERFSGIGSAVLKAAIGVERDKVLAEASKIDLAKSVENFGELKDRMERLSLLAVELDQAFGSKELASRNRALVQAADGWITRKRENVLRRYLKSSSLLKLDGISKEKREQNRADAVVEVKRATDRMRKLIGDLDRVVALLDEGYGVSEKAGGANNHAIIELIDEWKGTAALEDKEIAASVDPLMKRLENLKSLPKLSDVSELTSAGQKGDLAMRLGAWRQLGELTSIWPRGLGQFEKENDIRVGIEKVVRQEVDNAERRKTLLAELERGKLIRFENAISLSAGAGDAEGVGRMISMMGELNIQLSELGKQTEFNARLHQFRKSLVRVRKAKDETARKAGIVQLESQFESLLKLGGNVGRNKEMVRLKFLWTGAIKGDSQSFVTEAIETMIGPASNRVDEAIRFKATREQDRIVYRWDGRGRTQTLVFHRVEGDASGGGPYYICDVEVSVGLFGDMVAAKGDWEIVAKLLGVDRSHLRMGPKVWEWRRSARRMLKSRHWFAATGKGKKLYPSSWKVKKPSANHPMQYVSAAAALYFCRLLDCRLPTRSEWAAARSSLGGDISSANLRDRRWDQENQFLLDLARQSASVSLADLERPDSDIFWTDELGSLRRGANARPAVSTDDGILWFSEVSEGSGKGKIKHLVGNVSEFAFDSPQFMERSRPQKPDETVRFLKKAEAVQGLYVIGGSALSPSEIDVKKGYRVPAKELGYFKGYSDVGFRLVFSEPYISPLDKLIQYFRRVPYVTAGDGSKARE